MENYKDAYEYAKECERRYERDIDAIAEKVCSDPTITLVLVAGPSCAGKTTTTAKLREEIIKHGKTVYQVSLDDFYKEKCDAPIGEDGKPDLETIESLDLNYLHFFLSRLCEGIGAYAPTFDFQKQGRTDTFRRIDMEPGDVCIIEGLHALNPAIYEKYIDKSKLFRVFLDPQDNERYGFTKYELRRIRRLVRDYYNRDSSAENTLTMWHSVRAGERKWIYPFADCADVTVNTCFEYEPAVLRNKAIEILKTVSRTSEHWPKTEILLEKLEPIVPLSEDIVPEGSMLHEFIR